MQLSAKSSAGSQPMPYNHNYFGVTSHPSGSSTMSASNQAISNSRPGIGYSSYRGRGRGNGDSYGGGRSTWKIDDKMPLEAEDLPKGNVLAELEVAKLVEVAMGEQSGAEKYRKEDYELLASYNWTEKAGKPAIVVPGRFFSTSSIDCYTMERISEVNTI